MPSDPDKPLLQIKIKEEIDRPLGRRAFPRPPEPYSRQDQEKKFGPQFKRLQAVLDRKGGGLELRSDPHALAPERILILEVNGSVSELARAVSRVDGLELLIEEELDRPDLGEAHSLYLLMPEEAALKQILSMWQKWSEGKELPKGFTPWRDVFARLSDVRAWGPRDRVSDQDADAIDELMSDRSEDALLRLELELAPRKTGLAADRSERSLRGAIDQLGGVVVNQARIPEIGYHGLLVDLPGREVRRLLDREGAGLSGHDAVLFVRPQSATSAPAAGDQHEQEIVTQSAPLGKPIAALLDGVPLAAHPALQGRLSVDDLYGLESTDPEHRRHGTAMASLISLGDLGEQGEPLPRRLHVVPVLGGATEAFPNDRLLIDVIWQAVLSMKSGDTPSAEDVLIVNVSLGDVYRPFHGVPSAWARLIDRLAFDHGILFIVSAGNQIDPLLLAEIADSRELEEADDTTISEVTLASLANILGQRRVLSPAETLNGLTIGAANQDAERAFAGHRHRKPFEGLVFSNPSSRLGPGIGGATKPDVLMPGGAERLRLVSDVAGVKVQPFCGYRGAGLKVAAPSQGGNPSTFAYSGFTSGATALATRACHLIHDALEKDYGEAFLALPSRQRATVVKALFSHTARWNEDEPELVRRVIGPAGGSHQHKRDNIRRFIGLGMADASSAVGCLADRATFWACGELAVDRQAVFDIPLPACIEGEPGYHRVSATAAWFSPVSPGRQAYKAVRLDVLKPDALDSLGISNAKEQPDENQSVKGTVISRRWEGSKAADFGGADSFQLKVQRRPDLGPPIDEPVPFGLVVTIEMPGQIQIYEQVRLKLAPRVVIPATQAG